MTLTHPVGKRFRPERECTKTDQDLGHTESSQRGRTECFPCSGKTSRSSGSEVSLVFRVARLVRPAPLPRRQKSLAIARRFRSPLARVPVKGRSTGHPSGAASSYSWLEVFSGHFHSIVQMWLATDEGTSVRSAEWVQVPAPNSHQPGTRSLREGFQKFDRLLSADVDRGARAF